MASVAERTNRIDMLAFVRYVSYPCRMNTFAAWVESVGGAGKAAALLGYTPDAVRKWMRGERIPRPQTAALIEKASCGQVPRGSLLWPTDRRTDDRRTAA